MEDDTNKSHFWRLTDYISGQDIAQYLSLEKLKNIVMIVVAVAVPITFFVIEYQKLTLQAEQVELLRTLVEQQVH